MRIDRRRNESGLNAATGTRHCCSDASYNVQVRAFNAGVERQSCRVPRHLCLDVDMLAGLNQRIIALIWSKCYKVRSGGGRERHSCRVRGRPAPQLSRSFPGRKDSGACNDATAQRHHTADRFDIIRARARRSPEPRGWEVRPAGLGASAGSRAVAQGNSRRTPDHRCRRSRG